jgi:hypothetical protein
VIRRLLPMLVAAAVGVGAVAVLARAGGQGGIADAVSPDWRPHVDAWKRQLLAAANDDLTRYPTPGRRELDRRLAAVASRFHFRVLLVRFVRAPQGSPLVIVRAHSPREFSRDMPAVMRALDPKRGGREDWQGWDYEGFFLGAQDDRGQPFAGAFNFFRAHGGGQWARSEALYPFDHG